MRFVRCTPLLKTSMVAMAVLFVLVARSQAQGAWGKFTLSHPVHWGSGILPEGDYEYSISTSNPSPFLVLHNLTHKQGFLVMAQSSAVDYSDFSRLTIEERGDQKFVTAMYLAPLAQVLYFRAPHEHPAVARARNSPKDNPLGPAATP